MTTEATDEDPLKVKLTSVSHTDGTVSHHVVLTIEDAKVVFDDSDKKRAVDRAVGYLRQLADAGETRLRRLL